MIHDCILLLTKANTVALSNIVTHRKETVSMFAHAERMPKTSWKGKLVERAGAKAFATARVHVIIL